MHTPCLTSSASCIAGTTGGSRAKLSFLGNLGALAGAVRRARAKGDSILYLTPQLRGRKAEAGQQGAQESGRRLLPAALQVGRRGGGSVTFSVRLLCTGALAIR